MPNTPSRRAHRHLRAVLSLVLVAVAIGALVDSPRAGVAVSGGTTLPRGLFYSTLTWDPSGDRLLLFGGADGTVDSNELWAYDPDTDGWTRIIPKGTPPPGRFTHMAAWDGKRSRLLVFGGSEGTQTFADLLVYDPSANRWSRLEPEGERPSARALGSMVWDSDADRFLVFGGYAGHGDVNRNFNDLWSYDPVANKWTKMVPANAGPSARQAHSGVWDPVRHQMLVFGGWDFVTPHNFNDLWSYAPATNSWFQLRPNQEGASGPAGRFRHAAAWDPGGDRMLIFGGCCSLPQFFADTWAYSPATDVWAKVANDGPAPPARNRISGAWDPVRRQFLVWGGIGECFLQRDLWGYRSAEDRWVQLARTSFPALARVGHSAVWDSDANRVLAFGGCDSTTYSDDLLSLDPSTGEWTEIVPPGIAPEPRMEHRAAWDVQGHRLLIFGGLSGKGFMGDLWSFSPSSGTWAQLGSGAGPPARAGFAAAWDGTRRRLMVFGGYDPGRTFSDLWAYDAASNAWTSVQAGGEAPPRLAYPVGAWDPIGDQFLVYGGWNQGENLTDPFAKSYYDDVWAYRPATNAWTRIRPSGHWPPHRHRVDAVWATDTNRMIVAAGQEDQGVSHVVNDLWTFDPRSGSWALLSPSGARPEPRFQHSTTWTGSQLILFGGYGDEVLGDTWAFRVAENRWLRNVAERPALLHRAFVPLVALQ